MTCYANESAILCMRALALIKQARNQSYNQTGDHDIYGQTDYAAWLHAHAAVTTKLEQNRETIARLYAPWFEAPAAAGLQERT